MKPPRPSVPPESTSPQHRQVSCLPLGVLRLSVWVLLLLGLAIAPVDTVHGPSKYLGEAAEITLDASPDAEPEEADGDGNGIWQPAPQFTLFIGIPLKPCGGEAVSPVACVRAPLPARGPPESV